MMKFLIPVIIIFTLLSCSKTSDKNSGGASTDTLQPAVRDSMNSSADSVDYLRLESYIVPDQNDTTSCYIIHHNCAVIVNPTDKQIDDMIKLNGEDDFATIADDFSYYQSTAMQMIDSVGVKTESSEKQYIKFIGDKNS